jgi:hypothetical protein
MLFFQFIVQPHNYLLRNCYLQQLLAGLKAIISHPNPQLRRKNQRRHTGDEIRKNKASTSHETKDRKAENGRTPEDSESSGSHLMIIRKMRRSYTVCQDYEITQRIGGI